MVIKQVDRLGHVRHVDSNAEAVRLLSKRRDLRWIIVELRSGPHRGDATRGDSD